MGEGKQRQYNRGQFLAENPRCVYCGAPADTTDHCPPRSFFEKRQWPETFEFPACRFCNTEARLDEQALAVLVRCRSMQDRPLTQEWEKLAEGVKNNQPEILAEWNSLSATRRKRAFRTMFGRDEGDQLRWDDYGMVSIGPLTKAATFRFMIKLTKALFYKHNDALFDGIAYAYHTSLMQVDNPGKHVESILSSAPALAKSERNTKFLGDQFIYRFNYSPIEKTLYAVVRLSDQFVFQLMALPRDMDERLRTSSEAATSDFVQAGRFDCALKQP